MADDANGSVKLERMSRKLRIGVSVFFGVLTLALVALWVRSYWWRDNLYVTIRRIRVSISSEQGECALFVVPADSSLPIIYTNPWELANEFVRRKDFFPFDHRSLKWWGFDVFWLDFDYWGIFAPHWFAVVVAVLPVWILFRPWRLQFSVRTMLIVMTLLSLSWGLGVWLAS